MTKAENYRKRADVLEKTAKKRTRTNQRVIRTKQRALRDMADNEDWLDGKRGSAVRPETK